MRSLFFESEVHKAQGQHVLRVGKTTDKFNYKLDLDTFLVSNAIIGYHFPVTILVAHWVCFFCEGI